MPTMFVVSSSMIRKMILAMAAAITIPPCVAQLPMLGEQPWVGFFAAYQEKDYRFGVDAQGRGTLAMKSSSRKDLNHKLNYRVDFIVEEEAGGGYFRARKLQPETFSSKQPASINPKEPVTFTGKATGDVEFEVTISGEKGRVLIGGRILNRGNAKGKVRLTVRTAVPNHYPYDKTSTKDEIKKFERKTKRDKIALTFKDGTKERLEGGEEIDFRTAPQNAKGITELQFDFEGLRGREVEFRASPGTSFELWGRDRGKVFGGFSVNWSSDSDKDLEGKARMAILIK